MSTVVHGAELEVSSLNVVSVQRMSVECSVRLSAMDAHEVESRDLTFMAGIMIFTRKLHYKVTKGHLHAEIYSTLDSTLKSRRSQEGPPCSLLVSGRTNTTIPDLPENPP